MIAYGNVQLLDVEGKVGKLNRRVPGAQSGKAGIGRPRDPVLYTPSRKPFEDDIRTLSLAIIVQLGTLDSRIMLL